MLPCWTALHSIDLVNFLFPLRLYVLLNFATRLGMDSVQLEFSFAAIASVASLNAALKRALYSICSCFASSLAKLACLDDLPQCNTSSFSHIIISRWWKRSRKDAIVSPSSSSSSCSSAVTKESDNDRSDDGSVKGNVLVVAVPSSSLWSWLMTHDVVERSIIIPSLFFRPCSSSFCSCFFT